MDQIHSVVCICETHEQAQRAMYNLQGAGINMRTLLIASRDIYSDLHDLDDYNIGEETFNIPGLGSLLVSGPLASWIVTAFDNGAGGGGVSILGAALSTLGIPRDSILQYEAAMRPQPLTLISGSIALTMRKSPVRLMPMTLLQSARDISSKEWLGP